MSNKQSLGIYLHIPFCLKKCLYCDFCSFPGSDASLMQAYTAELCRRLNDAAPSCTDCRVDTLYFGGGTPTLLPLACWEQLFRCLSDCFDLSPSCEITCECNPATADRAYLHTLRDLGINRLSVGLQSVDNAELAHLGRCHSVADFFTLFSDARAVGFRNIGADLMYGIPQQTLRSFRHSLTVLAELSPEHISTYGLKIEEGTPFAAQRNHLVLPDEDIEYAMYCACTEVLGSHGYRKYEISNFAREGKESRHNLRYWLGQDYLGFGVAAHSCFRGVRFGNSRNLSAFLAGKDITEERIVLSAQDRKDEYLMLRLRLTDGIDEEEFRRLFGKTPEDYHPPLAQWLRGGLMKRENGHICLTDNGFFVSNAILSDLIGKETVSEE